jgi:hypothetical protein
MTKLTKKVALSLAVAAMTDSMPTDCPYTKDEVVAKLNEMIVQLDKKPAGEKPMTENQKQNVGFKADTLGYLADGQKRTATEILNGVESFPDGMTNQRVSALLRQLYLDGKVQKETVKGKTQFWATEGV